MDSKLNTLLTLLKTFNQPLSISQIAEHVEGSTRTVRRQLQQLEQLGLLTVEGKNRGVKYALASPTPKPTTEPPTHFTFTADNATF